MTAPAKLIEKLPSSNPWMSRFEAFVELKNLGPAVVDANIQEIVKYTQDNYPWMRALAIETLSVLEPGCLAPHAPLLVSRLGDIDADVCIAALRALAQLPAEVLACHRGAVCKRLDDEEVSVQLSALRALQRLESVSLVPHLEEIRLRTEDDSHEVRKLARQLLDRIDQDLAKLPKSVITLQRLPASMSDSLSVTGTNIAGNRVAELSVSPATTCGELRERIAQQSDVLKVQIKLVLEDATLVSEEADHTPLGDLIIPDFMPSDDSNVVAY